MLDVDSPVYIVTDGFYITSYALRTNWECFWKGYVLVLGPDFAT